MQENTEEKFRSNSLIKLYWLTCFHYCCSCLNEDYGIQCIQATCKLLEKICNLIHYYGYAHNYTDIPVACMNLVASVSGFAQVIHPKIIISLFKITD